MGHPKNSTISRRNNITRMATHKCHGATDNRTPEEAKGNRNISESIEGECVWTDDDESVENAQQDVWSISSNSSLIAVHDCKEENDIHPSDSHHFSMILSKGIASWYQLVTDARASNKQPHQYRGDLRTSQWRALKVAKQNGQTIRHFFNPVVSTHYTPPSTQSLYCFSTLTTYNMSTPSWHLLQVIPPTQLLSI